MPGDSSISLAEAIRLRTTVVVLLKCRWWHIIRERQERIRMCALFLDLRDIIDDMDFAGCVPQATVPQLGGEFSG